MAEIKKRVLSFSNGRQIKLYGNCIGISKSMELWEGYAPNMLSLTQEIGEKALAVNNPHKLTADELLELADSNIRLWMDFKDAVRANGVSSTKLFNKESIL
jgi:hypothetical protein